MKIVGHITEPSRKKNVFIGVAVSGIGDSYPTLPYHFLPRPTLGCLFGVRRLTAVDEQLGLLSCRSVVVSQCRSVVVSQCRSAALPFVNRCNVFVSLPNYSC